MLHNNYTREYTMSKSKVVKSISTLLSLMFVILYAGALNSAPVTLVENGNPKAIIVLAGDASPSESHGAQELQMFLQMISGAHLPIYRENEPVSGKTMILVGRSSRLQNIDSSIDFDDLGDEGFVMRTKGGNLILAGGKLRGSMYAVYTFLEEKLGCRWYSSMASYIPKMKTIRVDNIDEIQKPDFEYREPFWMDAFDPDWAARNKCNSSAARLDEQRGGKINWPGVHTFYPLMPPETWFEDHPEFFSFREGRRRWEYAQLCLTDPEVMKIMTAKVIAQMDAKPNDVLFEVSQNDWSGWCECSFCKAIDDREEAHSGTIVPFVNAIADRTKKHHPKKLVSTLAYAYTEKAPKYARPRDNVVIRLCNIVGCDVHPLETCEENNRFRESMAGWEPITEKMYVWDYVTDFPHYLMPLPNVESVIADIPWMLKHGVDGLFEQGCYTTKGGSLAELQAYLEAKLLWNTKADAHKVVDDFLNGYFGSAAAPIKKYIDLMHERVIRENLHHHYSIRPGDDFLTREFLDQADAYFDEAERLADNHDIAHRVAQWRMNLRYAKLGHPIEREVVGDLYKPVPEMEKYADLEELDKFIRDCYVYDIEELSEGSGLEYRYIELLANNATHRIVTLENQHLKVQFLPSMGGRIMQILHKKSGNEILATTGSRQGRYRGSGGYQESPSGVEVMDYSIEKTAGGQKLILQALKPMRRTHNGYFVKREMFLPDDKAEIKFSYVLQANVDLHSPQRIRTSPSFSFIDSNSVIAGAADKGGNLKPVELSGENTYRMRYVRYDERNLPNGSVAIGDKDKNIAIIEEFDPKELEYCTVGIGGNNRSSIRLEGKQRPLKAGETMELHHTLKIVDNAKSLIR